MTKAEIVAEIAKQTGVEKTVVMNAVSEKVTSAASSGKKMPSVTSCCMISQACCSREELLAVTGSDCGADGCFWVLSIAL